MTHQQSKTKRDRPPKPRGVQLGALDRSKVYRIGYVGRRWEVLGPVATSTGPEAGSAGALDAGERAEGPRTASGVAETASGPDGGTPD